MRNTLEFINLIQIQYNKFVFSFFTPRFVLKNNNGILQKERFKTDFVLFN